MRALALLLALLSAPALAQQPEYSEGDVKAAFERARAERSGQGMISPDAQDSSSPRVDCAAFEAGPLRESCQAAWQSYFDYRAHGLEHRRDVFEWQLSSSKVIFVTVLLLVAAGIYFAAVQFHAGLGRLRGGAGDEAVPAPYATELSASKEGIKVSSPVLGVIILVLSLGFFYLYLVYVYPIEEVF